MPKKKHRIGVKTNKNTTALKNKRKILIASTILITITILGGVGVFLFKYISDNNAEEQRKNEIAERINECIASTKKDALGFITNCYEKEGEIAPDDVLTKDKERVDRIIAQANYDACIANAKFKYEARWDLNDIYPYNSKTDSIRVNLANTIQDNYDQDVAECNTKYALKGDYEKGFKTSFWKELVGWKIPKNENIPIVDRYNDNGKIEEWSNMPDDEKIPDSVGSVGKMTAMSFKEEHAELWY